MISGLSELEEWNKSSKIGRDTIPLVRFRTFINNAQIYEKVCIDKALYTQPFQVSAFNIVCVTKYSA